MNTRFKAIIAATTTAVIAGGGASTWWYIDYQADQKAQAAHAAASNDLADATKDYAELATEARPLVQDCEDQVNDITVCQDLVSALRFEVPRAWSIPDDADRAMVEADTVKLVKTKQTVLEASTDLKEAADTVNEAFLVKADSDYETALAALVALIDTGETEFAASAGQVDDDTPRLSLRTSLDTAITLRDAGKPTSLEELRAGTAALGEASADIQAQSTAVTQMVTDTKNRAEQAALAAQQAAQAAQQTKTYTSSGSKPATVSGGARNTQSTGNTQKSGNTTPSTGGQNPTVDKSLPEWGKSNDYWKDVSTGPDICWEMDTQGNSWPCD